MSNHVALIERESENSADDIQRSLNIDSGDKSDVSFMGVLALRPELVNIQGKKESINRLFVKARDSGEYFKIGWILLNDVDHCMICGSSVTSSDAKFHCFSCGNVVCEDCSPEAG